MKQKARYCPDCGDVLSFGARACACGWKLEEPEQKKAHSKNCSVPGCPMAGSISTTIRGCGPWYCRWHWKEVTGANNPHMLAQITDDLKRNKPAREPDMLLTVMAERAKRQAA